MDTRALAHILHEGAKRPRAINELSACLLQFVYSGVDSFAVDISNELDERASLGLYPSAALHMCTLYYIDIDIDMVLTYIASVC